jgi:hypothetical protein
VGAVFFVASSYVLLRGALVNPSAALSIHRDVGWFPFAYMLFYALAGLFTAVFHVTCLVYGRPQQSTAGAAAIGVALILTALMTGIAYYIA